MSLAVTGVHLDGQPIGLRARDRVVPGMEEVVAEVRQRAARLTR